MSPSRMLNFIALKRKNISLLKGSEDKYGHWWIEIDGIESYGWWPKKPVGVIGTLVGVEGELNGQTTFGGTATRDPHNGDDADEEFNPKLVNSKTDEQVRQEIRTFATNYRGEWRWTFGWGQNCHTFQMALMKSVGLEDPRKPLEL